MILTCLVEHDGQQKNPNSNLSGSWFLSLSFSRNPAKYTGFLLSYRKDSIFAAAPSTALRTGSMVNRL